MSYWERTNRAVDKFCYAFSVYAVPLAVGLVSLIAWTTWNNEYAAISGEPLPFRVIEQTQPTMTPAEALTALSGSLAPVLQEETHLSEKPFWFLFSFTPKPSEGSDVHLELPSRHTQQLECWDAGTLQPLGSASRSTLEGAFARAKSGFELELHTPRPNLGVLCRAVHSGPARISVVQWSGDQLAQSVANDQHRSGLLEGSLLMLAAFVLLVAVVNQEWLYVLFAAWLLTNFRLAGLSTGWDLLWLGHAIPADWIHPLRKLAIAAYYILTYTLFVRLFVEDIRRIGYSALLHSAQLMGLPLLAAAIVLPYSLFLPAMWVIASLGSLILVYLLVRILMLSRSSVANWYGASIAIVLLSTISEIASAAVGVKNLFSASNSVTAAASSSLMAALAIAAQMREERRERVRAQAELRNTYEALPLGLFTTNLQGNFLQSNPAQKSMLGLSRNGSGELFWQDYFGDESWKFLRASAEGGCDIEIRGKEGTPLANKTFHVKATISGDRIEGSMQDVTDRAKATERLKYLAEYDPLTNVLNRRGIEKALAAATRGLAGPNPLAIAYLDLDRFKLINDLYGHTTGDDVLREICERIKGKLSPDHQIGRVGGDEFVIVFPNTPISVAAETCRGMIRAIEDEPCHIGDKAFQVKGSIGLIEVIDDTVFRDVISIADSACREAKRNPSSLVVYERGARAFRDRADELALISRFGVGLVPDGLFLEMQPIMSLTAPYDSLDFEVLLRLREADNSVTQAGKIISAAENNGRISLIDRWVLSSTLKWLSDNRERLPKTNFVCINLSGGSLNDEKFIRDAFAMVADAGRSIASMLCFEITESVALHDLGNTNRFIDSVRSYGAKVALDDFGAGYTSFSYLKKLAAEAVKIDGAFVRDVNAHPANLAIVEAIAELSHNLGMKTIAEWAEDAATVAVLQEAGVDYVQGYAVARPMSPERLLSADSCAALIEDPQVARIIWDGIGKLATPHIGEIPTGLTLPPLPQRRRH